MAARYRLDTFEVDRSSGRRSVHAMKAFSPAAKVSAVSRAAIAP
jgi:hypothetical protein